MHLSCPFRPERSWDLFHSCWNGPPSTTRGPCRRRTLVFTCTTTEMERCPLSKQLKDVSCSVRTRLRRRRSCQTDRNVCRKTWRRSASRVDVESTGTIRTRPAEDARIRSCRTGSSSSVEGDAWRTCTGVEQVWFSLSGRGIQPHACTLVSAKTKLPMLHKILIAKFVCGSSQAPSSQAPSSQTPCVAWPCTRQTIHRIPRQSQVCPSCPC